MYTRGIYSLRIYTNSKYIYVFCYYLTMKRWRIAVDRAVGAVLFQGRTRYELGVDSMLLTSAPRALPIFPYILHEMYLELLRSYPEVEKDY